MISANVDGRMISPKGSGLSGPTHPSAEKLGPNSEQAGARGDHRNYRSASSVVPNKRSKRLPGTEKSRRNFQRKLGDEQGR